VHVQALSGMKVDPQLDRIGAGHFSGICAACHGAEGKGNPAIGSADLTDDYWLYGNRVEDILAAIEKGHDGTCRRTAPSSAKRARAWSAPTCGRCPIRRPAAARRDGERRGALTCPACLRSVAGRARQRRAALRPPAAADGAAHRRDPVALVLLRRRGDDAVLRLRRSAGAARHQPAAPGHRPRGRLHDRLLPVLGATAGSSLFTWILLRPRAGSTRAGRPGAEAWPSHRKRARRDGGAMYVSERKIYPRDVDGRFQRLRIIAVFVLLGMYYLFPG
jgi:hypothetical protein